MGQRESFVHEMVTKKKMVMTYVLWEWPMYKNKRQAIVCMYVRMYTKNKYGPEIVNDQKKWFIDFQNDQPVLFVLCGYDWKQKKNVGSNWKWNNIQFQWNLVIKENKKWGNGNDKFEGPQ